MKLLIFVILLKSMIFAQHNLVTNGGFEDDLDNNGIPDNWAAYGNQRLVKQTLTIDVGREGKGKSAKLTCSEFSFGKPDSHAMIAQAGLVSVEKGKWYKFSFWAKAEGTEGKGVAVALRDTRTWKSCGLSEGFTPTKDWKYFEFFFKCTASVSETSRLQFWFTYTGTLWLDDVELIESEPKPPAPAHVLQIKDRTNFIPNSSFECGKSGWGSWSPQRLSWGNMNQLFGEIDSTVAVHGKNSLCISINPENILTYFFDYYGLYRVPIRIPLATNIGWIPLEKGKIYTLSVYLKSKEPEVVAELVVNFWQEGSFSKQAKQAKLTTDWQRYEFNFTAQSDFCFIAIGPNLEKSKTDSATVWIDAVQLERSERASKYQPSDEVEVMLETEKVGNIFFDPKDLTVRILGYNNTDSSQIASINLTVSDFFDKTVYERKLRISIPAKSKKIGRLSGISNKFGFYKIKAKIEALGKQSEQLLRTAVIKPYKQDDSIFGMNHAYPWEHLLLLAKQAGILWWRDWSVKWHSVEPEKGKFTFSETDAQIDRVLKVGAKVLVLFPFPSTYWSSSMPPEMKEKLKHASGFDRYLITGAMPKNVDDFANYISQSVKHYKNRVQCFEILNEPIHTSYALKGAKVEDYIKLLSIAYQSAKSVDPKCLIVGGIASGPTRLTKEVIEAGILDFIDIFNIHMYPGETDPRVYEGDMKKLLEMMNRQGKPKPIWVTEYGYYADDDPASSLLTSKWVRFTKNERVCSEYMVKFAAIMLAHNVKKIFYHSGNCGMVNMETFGGIFFEFGGSPRKMYPAQATMANLLPPEIEFIGLSNIKGVKGYCFLGSDGIVMVAWSENESLINLEIKTDKIKALDIMGNPISGEKIEVSSTPVYFVSKISNLNKFLKNISTVR